MLKHVFVLGTLVGVLAVFSAREAKADPLQLSCSSTCTSGSTTLIVSGSSVTFNFTGTGTANSGDAFVAIVVPYGGATPSLSGVTLTESEPGAQFNSGDDFDTIFLEAESDLSSGFNFSNLSSASGQVGVNPNSFTVYEFGLGSTTVGHNQTGIPNLTASNLTNGSIIVGWLETDDKTLQTPLSESITSGTKVPEPPTSTLLGLGLLALICAPFFAKRLYGIAA